MATTAASTANPYMTRQAEIIKLATTHTHAKCVSQLRAKITTLQQDLQAYGSMPSTTSKETQDKMKALGEEIGQAKHALSQAARSMSGLEKSPPLTSTCYILHSLVRQQS